MFDERGYTGMQRAPDEMLRGVLRSGKAYEIALVAKTVESYNWDFDRFKDAASADQLPYPIAKQRAVLEFGQVWATNYMVPALMPRSPQIYRLMRTLELAYGVKRTGTTLIVGSQEPHAEIVGLHTQSAQIDTLKTLFDRDIAAKLQASFQQQYENVQTAIQAGLFPRPTADLLPAQVTAIEPDVTVRQDALTASSIVSLGKNVQFNLLRLRLDQVVTNRQLPADIQTILFYRAEPKVFHSGTEGDRTSRLKEVTETLKPIFDRLTKDGAFVLTVGAGKGKAAERERGKLLKELQTVLPQRLNHQPFQELPISFIGRDEALYLGGPFGSIGGIASRSRTGS